MERRYYAVYEEGIKFPILVSNGRFTESDIKEIIEKTTGAPNLITVPDPSNPKVRVSIDNPHYEKMMRYKKISKEEADKLKQEQENKNRLQFQELMAKYK